MNDLSPIPIPPQQQWREFRIRRVPLICFSIALVAVALMWKSHVTGPVLVGEVEVVRSDVISTMPGLLAEVYVDRLDKVTKGQPIAKILPTDPEVLKANLAAVEMELKVLRARMALDQTRNEFDYEKLKLDWLNKKVEVATAELNFRLAQEEYARTSTLWEENLVSASTYETAKTLRDVSATELVEKNEIVEQLDIRLQQLAKSRETQNADNPWVQAIAAQETQLLMVEGPITLRAAMDGFVSEIMFRAGDRVMGGLPIVSISAGQSSRIVGYVRQPLTAVPKPGDKVEIRTRGMPRKTAVGTVTQVGSELRMLSPALSVRGFTNMEERGLPFLVSLPPELTVFPGEIVDLSLQN